MDPASIHNHHNEPTSELRGSSPEQYIELITKEIAERSEKEESKKAETFAIKTMPPNLNRRTRRQLVRAIKSEARTCHAHADNLIELKKHMARPPGCAFLGAKATEGQAFINSETENHVPVIFDSGSDITLISWKTIQKMRKVPRIRSGQKIQLIQVTGSAEINGYCILDLIFDTSEGPVKMNIEAYVVKGMGASFILGNDFADQYSISTIRELGRTYIQFADSGRRIEVQNSVSSPFIDEEGHAFKVRVRKEAAGSAEKAARHRRNQKN